jgi:Rps23 Pro-64 3,4-dihydroxylase Tpa1-like proline 4-hydroxylase
MKVDFISTKQVAFSYINNAFSKSQWEEISSIVYEISCQPILLEHIIKGVERLKGIKFSLDLHRFIVREGGISQITNSPYSQAILTIINHSSLIKKVSNLFGKEVEILRMQLNIMTTGDFISEHADKESDDSYLCAILIRTNSKYTGGDLTIYDAEQKSYKMRQPNQSILVMNSHCIHKVDPITSGFRHTICLFLG